MRLPSILMLSLAALAAAACSDPIPEPEPAPKPAKSADAKKEEPKELEKEDVAVGTGDRAVKTGDKIEVHYTGRLWRNGFKFDSSIGKDPFELTVGEGVIEGWSQGVVGMKKGGKRKLTIPASLGYGDRGSPPKIPGDAALVFDIEMLGWKDEATPAASASASAGAAKDEKAPKKVARPKAAAPPADPHGH
jgi:FKBP-type peptidyl-prolyl cis-trans isomerase FkpA